VTTLVADADLGRQPSGVVELGPGHRLRRRRHRQRPLAEGAVGQRRHHAESTPPE
jgi:hypothetical protein